MAKRKIIKIDEEKCNGCGLCIPNCPEGALQMIDGKARLVSDLCCDGLGACIGKCPEGAITIEEREAVEYDEKEVMKSIIKQGKKVIKAHLEHLKEHGEEVYYKEAVNFLKEKGIELPGEDEGSKEEGQRISDLTQWPVQLHLVKPNAAYFQGRDVVLAADCVAYALADFHKDYLKGKSLAIACPKLDSDQDVYLNKIIELINTAKINTLTVMTMEVPCCGGLLAIAKNSAEKAERKIPVKHIVVGIQGDVLKEEWI